MLGVRIGQYVANLGYIDDLKGGRANRIKLFFMDSNFLEQIEEYEGSPAPTKQDATPEALISLDSALQRKDSRAAEDCLRSPVISSNMDHKAIAMYLLVGHNCEKNLVSLALSVFKGNNAQARPQTAGSRAHNATAQDDKLLQSIIDGENADGLYDFDGDFRIVRDYTWKRCISLGYSLILNALITREDAFEVEYEDLV